MTPLPVAGAAGGCSWFDSIWLLGTPLAWPGVWGDPVLRGARTPISVDGVRSKAGAGTTVNQPTSPNIISAPCVGTSPSAALKAVVGKFGTGEIIEGLPLGLSKQGPLQQEENEDVGVLGGFTEVVVAVFRSKWILSSLISFVEL